MTRRDKVELTIMTTILVAFLYVGISAIVDLNDGRVQKTVDSMVNR